VRVSPFTARVLAAVRRIPPGRVATYGDIALLAGRSRAWRAVGNIMATCRAGDVPCHRVVASGGGLGGYGGNTAIKRALLRAEGLIVVGTRIRRWREVRVSLAPVKTIAGNSAPRRAVSTGRHR
jgi:O-6-methylguanine DNA methyltransferase